MSPMPAHPGPARTEPSSVSNDSGAAANLNVGAALATDTALTVTLHPDSAGTTAETAFGKTLTHVSFDQGAAGTETLAAADASNKHKLLGIVLTLDANGTVQFADDDGDLSGAIQVLGTAPFVVPTSLIPYLETNAVNKKLDLVTVGGAAKGFAVILTEP